MGDQRRSVRTGGGGRIDELPSRPPTETGPAASEPADRPGASGHRFGPGLVCSECGIRWDAHQRKPAPCIARPLPDPFARRPLDPG